MSQIDQSIRLHLASRSPFIYIVSWEEDRVLNQLTKLAEPLFSNTYIWSITKGLVPAGKDPLEDKYKGPFAALQYIANNKERALYILQDFHPFISESSITRQMRDLIQDLQCSGSVIAILSPKLNLPMELEKDISILDYPLPNIEDVKRLYQRIEKGVAHNERLSINLSDNEKDVLLNAALGLTGNEIKNVFAKALVSGASLDISDIDIILDEKKQIIRKSEVLEYYPTVENFNDIGGLDALKSWLTIRKDAFSNKARKFRLPAPKGLLLTGLPGCGKSLAAKAVAHEWNQPLIKMDVGRLFGGLVGESEKNVRKAIEFAEAVAPAILWIDEIEKGFSGIKSSGDSGTSSRVFSTFLTWMQEKNSSVFVIATANDITALPPELLRKGRFDEIFFVDLPFEDERLKILTIHLKRHGRDIKKLGANMSTVAKCTENMSGAEIEQLVISALYIAFSNGRDLILEDLIQVSEETYPLCKTMAEPIAKMREWAKHRARYASSLHRDEQGKEVDSERWSSISSITK